VPELPVKRPELDYLGRDEMSATSTRASSTTGRSQSPDRRARISEALAVRWPDADLDTGVVRPTIG